MIPNLAESRVARSGVARHFLFQNKTLKLQGMKEWLASELNVPVHMAPNPLEAVAIGTGKSLKIINKLQKAAK